MAPKILKICRMVTNILFVALCIARKSQSSPVDMPVNVMMPPYLADPEGRSQTGLSVLSPYDKYGAPPDNYPVVIPGMAMPNYYDDNITYPGAYDESDCHSVRNCPWEFPDSHSDPYTSLIHGGIGFLGPPLLPSPGPTEEAWKCNVEADCFAQEQIPRNLSKETEVLFLRSYTFKALEKGNLSVVPPLVKLRIEYSDLKIIYPGAFASQVTLEVLELEGNDIEEILPSTFAELTSLKTLDLSNNEIEKLTRRMFAGLEKLTDLSIGTNSLSTVPNQIFDDLPELEMLTLEDNNITFIEPYAFSGLTKLKSVYLNHNKLTSVPIVALQQLPNLINLQLSGNPITNISRYDFKGLDKLRSLYLDECGLENIEKRAFHNKKFRILDLSDNNLKFVPNLGMLERLRTVRLDNNPWVCDCTLWPTLRWLRRHGFTSPSSHPECSSPSYLAGTNSFGLKQNDLCLPPEPNPTPQAPGTILKKELSSQPNFGSSQIHSNFYITTNRSGASDSYEYISAADYYSDSYSVPYGGWSKTTYDTKKLYAVEDQTVTTPDVITERNAEEKLFHSTSGLHNSASTHSKEFVATELSKEVTAISSSPTERVATDQIAEKPPAIPGFEDATTEQIHAYTDAPNLRLEDTDSSNGISSPMFIIIAVGVGAVLGVFSMVALVKIIIYKNQAKKIKEKKSKELKLRTSNGRPDPNQHDANQNGHPLPKTDDVSSGEKAPINDNECET